MRQIDNKWYDELDDKWWDRRGPMHLLHEMNPTRTGYFIRVMRRQGLPAGAKVLDVGCGGGLVSETLAQAGFNVTGLDFSLKSVQAARRHALKRGLTPDYITADATRLPFAGASFDAVVSSDFLEHVSDKLDLITGEMARVLKPGGLLLYDTINRTLLSRLGVIWGGRIVSPLLQIPPNVHTWPMLIRPAELQAALRRAGVRPQEVRGLSPALPLWQIPLNLLAKQEVGGFKISRDLRLSYIGWGQKETMKDEG